MDAIKLEHRLELAGEDHRFFDHLCWGDADDEFSDIGFKKGVNKHYPIPQRDINASGSGLVQRAGY
ncbi:MAG: RagB/SusD family nutrient uptake outer membrane protein [Bacteroidales bacterium]|nr:RagB/SusD family nutrient uptake outer membrane protein [Bacteroidales bacterium]MBN2818292.1 RagB/SusD family nutrient uptake outer membrane protein [Bacteroidales bacterium]